MAGSGATPPPAGARGALSGRSVVLAFAPVGERELAQANGLSVGIMSASQGEYSTAQFLLDLTQGARVASSSYPHPRPPSLALAPTGSGAGTGSGGSGSDSFGSDGFGAGSLGSGGSIAGWGAARRRAEKAPQLLRPGLLASEIPGGAGYVGVDGTAAVDAPAAAGRDGRIAAVSLGAATTLLARIAAMRTRERLVVADLPGGAQGHADLLALSEERPPGELLIVIQRLPTGRGGELLWTGVGGLAGGGGGELTSQSTNERGLIASFDVAPTILDRLGAAIPPDVRGKPIVTDGRLRSGALRTLMARLRVIAGRRLKALAVLLGAWALLLLLAAPWPRARARAIRAGALGVLWAPVAVLIPAAFAPGAAVEYATIALACLVLGALTDALVPWPRAPLAPAVVAIVVLSTDALAGTQLLMRSLLGPDPILGARFYGIGNELKSGLAVLVLAAVAGALYPSARGARAAGAMVAAGVVLAVVEGSARIGAGVGGVILVSFAFAVATAMLAPGALTRRRTLIVLVSPLVALVALAGIDLATAHGGGHFTGSVLHARSAGDVRDIIVRRYGAAWKELRNHAMPLATACALACGALGVRARERLLAPLGGDPAWLAALCGGLAAGIVGALVEDSGPVLLVVAVFALGCVLSYVWSQPQAMRARVAQSGRSPTPLGSGPSVSSSPGIGSIGSGP